MPTITKKIKNPDAPGGRNDWKGRTPRERMNLTNAQLLIIKEWADKASLSQEFGIEEQKLYERVCEHIEQIQTPLMAESVSFPLFEEGFEYE